MKLDETILSTTATHQSHPTLEEATPKQRSAPAKDSEGRSPQPMLSPQVPKSASNTYPGQKDPQRHPSYPVASHAQLFAMETDITDSSQGPAQRTASSLVSIPTSLETAVESSDNIHSSLPAAIQSMSIPDPEGETRVETSTGASSQTPVKQIVDATCRDSAIQNHQNVDDQWPIDWAERRDKLMTQRALSNRLKNSNSDSSAFGDIDTTKSCCARIGDFPIAPSPEFSRNGDCFPV
ncbi:hypothetical protein BLNAU_8259 [Blattamonas nauphoetae]|uniref:Uncharacterized protein n=1 Tax=Blattamonas nauphoetae TaxID=2049346 RepID=A0ABQ9XZ89_9EUKA|nr:hypothetical protein BLNAU_8259 [Blattamonas nauphoetae]